MYYELQTRNLFWNWNMLWVIQFAIHWKKISITICIIYNNEDAWKIITDCIIYNDNIFKMYYELCIP